MAGQNKQHGVRAVAEDALLIRGGTPTDIDNEGQVPPFQVVADVGHEGVGELPLVAQQAHGLWLRLHVPVPFPVRTCAQDVVIDVTLAQGLGQAVGEDGFPAVRGPPTMMAGNWRCMLPRRDWVNGRMPPVGDGATLAAMRELYHACAWGATVKVMRILRHLLIDPCRRCAMLGSERCDAKLHCVPNPYPKGVPRDDKLIYHAGLCRLLILLLGGRIQPAAMTALPVATRCGGVHRVAGHRRCGRQHGRSAASSLPRHADRRGASCLSHCAGCNSASGRIAAARVSRLHPNYLPDRRAGADDDGRI